MTAGFGLRWRDMLNACQRQDGIAEIIEQTIERAGDQDEADRHDDFQAFLGFLQIPEFACPDETVSGRVAVSRCWRFVAAPPQPFHRGPGRGR
jgi:hypothetical protein